MRRERLKLSDSRVCLAVPRCDLNPFSFFFFFKLFWGRDVHSSQSYSHTPSLALWHPVVNRCLRVCPKTSVCFSRLCHWPTQQKWTGAARVWYCRATLSRDYTTSVDGQTVSYWYWRRSLTRPAATMKTFPGEICIYATGWLGKGSTKK